MRIWTRLRRFTRMPFRVVFSLMLLSWVGIFLLFTYYSQNSVAVDDVVGTALTKNVDPNLYYIRDIRWLSNSRKQSNRTFKVRKKILIVQRHQASDRRFKVAHVICKLLDGYRLSYELTKVDDRPFVGIKDALRPEITIGKYSLILFVDIKTFLDLKENAKNSLNSYSRKFNTGILFFATNYVGYARDFQFDIRKPEKEKSPLFVKVNSTSSILRITKDGGQAERPRVPKGIGTRWTYLSFDPARVPYETVSYVLPGLPLAKKRRRRRTTVMSPQFDRVTVLLDPGKKDGVKRVFFAGGFPFFLHTMLFLDSLDFLSQKTLTFSLDRYLQVDMDDVFIGSSGLRLQRDDVMDLLSVQSSLAEKIPGFRFNLGYSGKGYKRGSLEEDEGDEAILEYAHRFTWFGHLFDHEQAHRFSLKYLIKSMKKNKKFAEDYGIPLNTSYAVAPHHSGVYPVHEDLYTAWNTVDKITVTSTEEYPHLKPAWLRRGFIYRGIKVLPRQTCGLFTSTNFFKQIKGGRKVLDRSIHGGELFETLLRNPIMIIMTHMTNYANDRLAQYTITQLVDYVNQWTNVKLRYAPPTKLAEIYFGLFPQDKTPLWQSPCDDQRHLLIWKSDKTCSKLPSFLLVGPPHGGLELLQSLLHLNPDIMPMTNANNSSKEVQFFSSENYLKGLDWYMDHFVKPSNPNKISYEPSHSYFTSQAAPRRVNALLKSAKIVFVLEDPVMIAYAHYKHLLARNKLSHSKFTDIVTSQTNPELLRMRTAILRPGHYAEHIGRWMKFINPNQMLIIDLNELVNQPINVMNLLQEFLAVDHPLQYNKHVRYSKEKSAFCQILPSNATGNCYRYEKTVPDTLDESTIKYLQRYYAIHNKNLMRINQKIQFKLPKWLQDVG